MYDILRFLKNWRTTFLKNNSISIFLKLCVSYGHSVLYIMEKIVV